VKILIDECLPDELKESFAAMGHECETVRRAGYGSKKNGELLVLAEDQWDVLLTSDRNIKYQQNMTGRRISILIPRAALDAQVRDRLQASVWPPAHQRLRHRLG
jgi:predicted nuclease of predicted toxin-antitoxin system